MDKVLFGFLATISLVYGITFAEDIDFPLRESTTQPGCLETQTNKIVYYYLPSVLGKLDIHYGVSDSNYSDFEKTILDLWEPLTISEEILQPRDSRFISENLFENEFIDPQLRLDTVSGFVTDFRVRYGTGKHLFGLGPFFWNLYVLKNNDVEPTTAFSVFECARIPDKFDWMPVPGRLGKGPFIVPSSVISGP